MRIKGKNIDVVNCNNLWTQETFLKDSLILGNPKAPIDNQGESMTQLNDWRGHPSLISVLNRFTLSRKNNAQKPIGLNPHLFRKQTMQKRMGLRF
jgi:hypothetical protein